MAFHVFWGIFLNSDYSGYSDYKYYRHYNYLREQSRNELFHLGHALFYALEQLHLCPCADDVVLGIGNLVVGVAIEVIAQESHGLHIREKRSGIGEVRNLDVGEEPCAFEIAAGESFEDLHVEAHAAEVGFIFGSGVGRSAQEVAVVGEDEVRHHGVEVDDAKHPSLVVEENVIHLRVAVADALGQKSGTIESFALAHRFGSSLDALDEVANLGYSSDTVVANRLTELLKAKLHIVEVGNGFAQLDGDICQHILEFSEGKAGKVRILGIDHIEALRIGDANHQSPIRFAVEMVVFTFAGGKESKHAAVEVFDALLFQFLANMIGDGNDVVHQHIHIFEDVVVDALKHVVGCVIALGDDAECVVDVSVPKRLHGSGFPFEVESRNYLLFLLHVVEKIRGKDNAYFSRKYIKISNYTQTNSEFFTVFRPNIWK